MKKLIFFAIASAILLFSLIVVNIAPIINGLVVDSDNWFSQACNSISDEYDEEKKKDLSLFSNDQKEKDKSLDRIKKRLNRCNRKKAMVGLEYVSSNINIVFGSICTLLGFLYFMNIGNMVGKYIGLIGLGVGCVGFVLTFVYVIESGLVFDDYVSNDSNIDNMRIDSDGAYLEWNGSKNRYTCIFYEQDDEDSVFLRYSDYGKKYLSYHKDFNYAEGDTKYILDQTYGCVSTSINSWLECKDLDENNLQHSGLNGKIKYKDTSFPHSDKGECDKLYYFYTSYPTPNNSKKVTYDRWLTTIIFSCFIFLLNIGLAIFGFLLFRGSDGSSGQVAIK